MMKFNWKNIFAFLFRNKDKIIEAAKPIIDQVEEIIDDIKKDKPDIPAPEEIPEPEEIPDQSNHLQSTEKVWVWIEPSTVTALSLKKCGLNPQNCIITDMKGNTRNCKKMQKLGATVYLLVHPLYKRWQKGKTQALENIRKVVNFYDGIVLDFEGPLRNAQFVEDLKQFGKPVVIAPKASAKWMNDWGEHFKTLQGVDFLWWNYSYSLNMWQDFFATYHFDKNSKHNVLLSIGKKYRRYVSDAECLNIINNLQIRVGVFQPKNDYAMTARFSHQLQKTKTKKQ